MTTEQSPADPSAAKKEQLWITVFMLIPVLTLSRLSDRFTDDSTLRIIYAALLGALGGITGFGAYFLVKTRPAYLRVLTLIVLAVLSVAMLFVFDKGAPAYRTCEVCGYIAINEEQDCEVCASSTWEKDKADYPGETKEQWLREEQLFFFALDSVNEPLDFYAPAVEGDFLKDNSWKPVISRAELIRQLDHEEDH